MSILTRPSTVQINHTKPTASISHSVYQVEQKNKAILLKKILREKEITTAIVFTRTKHKTKNLARQLQKTGCKATSLQGNLSQHKRLLALEGYKSGTYNILVATDIAARGIDVAGVSHVINFDMPATAETYTHQPGGQAIAARPSPLQQQMTTRWQGPLNVPLAKNWSTQEYNSHPQGSLKNWGCRGRKNLPTESGRSVAVAI